MFIIVAVGVARGRNARMELKAPRVLISKDVHHSFGSELVIVPGWARWPALWTRMSSGEVVWARICANAASRLEREVISAVTATNLVFGCRDSSLVLASPRVFGV